MFYVPAQDSGLVLQAHLSAGVIDRRVLCQ